jgi:hypothetical protein
MRIALIGTVIMFLVCLLRVIAPEVATVSGVFRSLSDENYDASALQEKYAKHKCGKADVIAYQQYRPEQAGTSVNWQHFVPYLVVTCVNSDMEATDVSEISTLGALPL